MSEMTLEQALVLDALNEAGRRYPDAANAIAWLSGALVDAHLSHAPGQVTDEMVELYKKLHSDGMAIHDAKEVAAGRSPRLHESVDAGTKYALKHFSARLAQPVAAKVPDAVAKMIDNQKTPSAEDRALITENLDFLLSQPHPQAAQGGEAVGEIDCLVACRRLKTLVENYEHGETGEAFGDKEWLVHDFIAGSDVWSVFESLYSQPAERAAVPEEVIELLRDLSVYRSSTYKAVLNAFGNRAKSLLDSLSAAPTLAGKGSYQQRVADWMQQAFIPSLYSNMTERGDRVLEEVLELLQSHGYDPARVATLVQYVFGRPAGEPAQEVGGVMVTLAGYCFIAGLDMHAAGEAELARICQPEVMAKIRAKQEAKNALHFDTPLPGQPAETEAR